MATSEILSKDRIVVWARPLHLWVNALAMLLIVIASLAVVFIFPERISGLIDLIKALSGALTTSNAVAGVYTWRRSDDKRAATAAAD